METLTHEQLVSMVRTEWENWQGALFQVGRERIEKPGAAGKWSTKDLIVHVTWSEREMLILLRSRSLANGSPLWLKPQDERNQAIYEANHERPLEEVLEEAERIHTELAAEIDRLSEADLHDTDRYLGMPSEWVPWQVLGGSTYRHYREHADDLRHWLFGSLKGSDADERGDKK